MCVRRMNSVTRQSKLCFSLVFFFFFSLSFCKPGLTGQATQPLAIKRKKKKNHQKIIQCQIVTVGSVPSYLVCSGGSSSLPSWLVGGRKANRGLECVWPGGFSALEIFGLGWKSFPLRAVPPPQKRSLPLLPAVRQGSEEMDVPMSS